ncbi:MAG: glycoside hydrolase family 9 [Verrucomicrobia bacterium]|nr:MAG: glycoside hydrolase family 9 [Verrucomicrobiota bacterium]
MALGLGLSVLFAGRPITAANGVSDFNPLALPQAGDHALNILSPTMLELTLVNTKPPDPARVPSWDFVETTGEFHLPAAAEFEVAVGGQTIPVQAVGFKRRVLYAPLKERDLRIGNYLYLQLAAPVPADQTVEVKNPSGQLWPANRQFIGTASPLRLGRAIHVNQVGYLPAFPKKAMVGFYLGSLGELMLAGSPNFKLVEATSGKEIFHGRLAPRLDRGFPFPCYQHVYEADFSEVKTPGEYRLVVPGSGASFAFRIDDGVAMCFARTYALGLYHQRCGTANELPFTRFIHDPCHLAPAEVPTLQFTQTQRFLAESSADYRNNLRHTAPQLKNTASSLYPFVNQGKVDVSGGHHEAGDYSKYTLNSAAFIHFLVFAADVFPGVGDLDNLGLPESDDGKSDLLQEAKREADFLAKIQDADGGFYFLVYPRNRRYENNVLPEHGDPQIVWPKNTAATAASVAALAQCASSPLFKKQFPEAAANYLAKARLGWTFLTNAIARHGKDGAYQKLTHYGNDFMHDDELAWAACEMFLATGDTTYHQRLLQWLKPADGNARKWGWWGLYEGYGCAIRSYAFAEKTGRLKRDQLHPILLIECEKEIIKGAEDDFRRAQDSAYGTSFPEETKRVRSAGWYFSMDRAFDLAAACQLNQPVYNDPRRIFFEAILSNLNYEGGCNPVNVCYLTGLGWQRQREIVHQYAQNDRRVLPPSGLMLGNLQGGFAWLDHYGNELGALTFPSDGAQDVPYPIYDRWSDSFNVTTEFVIVNPARSLVTIALLAAQTPLKNQRWRSAPAQIEVQPTESNAGAPTYLARLRAPGLDLAQAQIVWEARDQEPAFGGTFVFTPAGSGPQWVEAEALWPDGRRVFAATEFTPAASQTSVQRRSGLTK